MRGCGHNQRGRRGIVWMLLAVLWPMFAGAQTSTLKIGYVDMKRLLDNAPQVADGRRLIEADFRSRDAQLNVEQTRLDEMQKRERRDAAVMPKANADALRQEIQVLKLSLERTRKKLAEDLKTRSDEEISRRWPEINNAVVEHARANGYDLVVHAPVLYASAAIDITDEVLAKLRSQVAPAGGR